MEKNYRKKINMSLNSNMEIETEFIKDISDYVEV